MRRTMDSVEELERKARLLADRIRASNSKVIYLYPRGGRETSTRNRVEIALLDALTRSTLPPSASWARHDKLRSMTEECGYIIHEWTQDEGITK